MSAPQNVKLFRFSFPTPKKKRNISCLLIYEYFSLSTASTFFSAFLSVSTLCISHTTKNMCTKIYERLIMNLSSFMVSSLSSAACFWTTGLFSALWLQLIQCREDKVIHGNLKNWLPCVDSTQASPELPNLPTWKERKFIFRRERFLVFVRSLVLLI